MAFVMNKSTLNTFVVPAIGAGDPAMITQASKVPLRVVVRNIGPVALLIAHTDNELSKIASVTGVFLIPPGLEDTFVLAPDQGLYAAATGVGGRMCVAISEAWPFLLEKS